jgi:hypothetical protein
MDLVGYICSMFLNWIITFNQVYDISILLTDYDGDIAGLQMHNWIV